MEVIFSTEVRYALENYRETLKNYPISLERAHHKYDDMVDSLIGLGTSIATPPLCLYKDLGQVFNVNGKPQNKNLKRYNYKDESGFQWAFACNYDYSTDTIIITKMMPANQVKEEKSNDKNPILEFMERLDLIK